MQRDKNITYRRVVQTRNISEFVIIDKCDAS